MSGAWFDHSKPLPRRAVRKVGKVIYWPVYWLGAFLLMNLIVVGAGLLLGSVALLVALFVGSSG